VMVISFNRERRSFRASFDRALFDGGLLLMLTSLFIVRAWACKRMLSSRAEKARE
jgi:flagellar biogenesis protein FliO